MAAVSSSSLSSCGLYLAPSTIPNAGLGIFTGIPRNPGDRIGSMENDDDDDVGFGDVCIPLLDLEWHNIKEQLQQHPNDEEAIHFYNPFGNYEWSGLAMGMGSLVDVQYEQVSAFWPGLNAAINGHNVLINVARSLPSHLEDYHPATNHKYHKYHTIENERVSAGSMTPYHNGSSLVTKPIPAGGEIFKFYGDDWFQQRFSESLPGSYEFQKAEQLLQTMHRKLKLNSSDPTLLEKVYNQLLLPIRELYRDESKILQALPPVPYQELLLREQPATSTTNTKLKTDASTTSENLLYSYHQSTAWRSLEYLENNGICIDSTLLKTRQSTIPHAGRGVFARRSFAKGTIITASPVIVIHNQSIFDMSDSNPPAETTTTRTTTTTTTPNTQPKQQPQQQLVTNYCFGHDTTTVLFCPYAGAIGIHAINHPPTNNDKNKNNNNRNHAKKEANVRIQWAKEKGKLLHDPKWLDMPLHEGWVVETKDIRLVVEYVALRDIAPGDELWLDYGPSWERAWNKHSKDYYNQQQQQQQQRQQEEYVSARRFSREQQGDFLWTVQETEQDPTAKQHLPPKNIELRCHSGLLLRPHWQYKPKFLPWEGNEIPGDDPELGHPCRILKRRKRKQKRHEHNQTNTRHVVEDQRPQQQHSFTYDVEVSILDEDTGEIKFVEKHHVPRIAMKWFDKPHTTEIYSSTAFRHWIGLPDDMVMNAWKNKEVPQKTAPSGPDISIEAETQETTSLPNDENEGTVDHSVCGLYLAESTIPNAGMGIFSRIERKVGDLVGDGDVAIPILDLSLHMSEKEPYFNPTGNYLWDGTNMGMGTEVWSEDVNAYWPGINCAVNCFAPLINLEHSTPIYDSAKVHRHRHPGAGAFTPYHLGISSVSYPIPAGGELFKDYGDEWFLGREAFENVPVVSDFATAEDLLEIFFELEVVNDGLENVGNSKIGNGAYYSVMREISKTWSQRLANALPETYEKARFVAQERNGSIGSLYQPNATREISWLEQNGRCLDHIVPGKSTIENAGHGAFAKRFLPKDTIISGSPLHHMFRYLMDMYELKHDEETDEWAHQKKDEGNKTSSIKKGHQLLLNYCYGHEDLTLLLCPYGSGVNYINHNQTLVNVKIQWPPNGTSSHNSSWLSMEPSDMEWHYHPKLAFDFVATKDIEEGEELFLDYGDAWEAAWTKHAAQWKPNNDSKFYMSSDDWNQRTYNEALLTEEEQLNDPYPDNISIQCHSMLAWNDEEAASLSDTLVVDNEETLPWVQQDFEWDASEYGHPCLILERYEDDSQWTYDVILEVQDDSGSLSEEVFQHRVPRRAISFFDRPYTSDIHLSSAFRHEIGIPMEMIPALWKDRTTSDDDGKSTRQNYHSVHHEL